MKNFISMVVTTILVFAYANGYTQNVVLVNGQATEVVLDGDDIKKIVKNKIIDYMKEYGQEVDEEFKKANLRFEKAKVEKPAKSNSLMANPTSKAIASVTEETALTDYKRE